MADGDSLMALQAAVHEVLVREPVARYLLRVVTATRDHADLALGASPRGALSFFRACQARALIAGRDHVTPDDVQALAAPVLRVTGRDAPMPYNKKLEQSLLPGRERITAALRKLARY